MDMGDQYGLPDLRRLLTRRTPFPASLPQPCEPYFGYRNNMAPSASNYHDQAAYMMSNGSVMPGGLLRFGTASSSGDGGWSMGNIDGGNSRWPRQETLTLLEIRSRLDSKFKEANQKGPLWDEVSRIMADEYGYQRSGKKCREKFENLYKYYKKTKEGKAGRQDGKHYRFFKQLEAIYGETSNHQRISAPETNILLLQENNQGPMQEHKISESLSFSGSEFEASSSENMDDHDEDELSAIAFMVNQKRVDKNKGWKGKVKEFVDSQMKKLINSQDVWMERMLKVIEEKEQERLLKEEEWRREETARFDKEHEFWAKERAWIEARDASLMAAFRKLTPAAAETQNEHENEVPTLERRFQENINRYSKQRMWELEIEGKMVSLGYDHHQHEANDAECYKKRKEDYFQQHINSIDGPENKSVYGVKRRVDQAAMDSSSSHSNSYDMNLFQLSVVNQGDQWDRYKGKNQQI